MRAVTSLSLFGRPDMDQFQFRQTGIHVLILSCPEDYVKILTACFLLMSAVLPRSAYADAKVGERIAEDICTTCHVVKKGQAVQPVYDDALPSFEEIASRRDFNRTWLNDFLKNKHASAANPGGMPDVRLTPVQIDNVSDYIVTFKTH